MKASVYSKYGPPEIIQIKEVDKPIPSEKQVLVKVYATTVNRTDCGFRSAEYFISRFFTGLFRPKNKILGNEFAGKIEAIGKDVTSFAIGESVFGFNDKTLGAHAEYMLMPEDGAMAILPINMTFEEAAPICEGGHYALVDIRAAKVEKGQNTLVYGATGAIGSAAVQLLKHFGATVTAVCDTKNIELVRSLGADAVIDYTKENYTNTGQKFDFIFDAVGKSSFKEGKKVLTKKGIYISTELGKNSANIFLALFTPFFGGKKVLFPIPTMSKEDAILFKQLVESGEYKPLIDSYFSLNEIVEAYRYVEKGQKVGNVIIRVNNED